MSVLENVVGGLANAAGSGYTANLVTQGQKDRKASAHEQLQANTKMILDEVQDLHEKKSRLQPGTDDQAIGAIDKRLGELQGSFTDLYHPEKNPGALQYLGGFLKAHLGGKPQVPATPAEAKAKFSWASGPAGLAPPSATEDKIGLWMKDATNNLVPARLVNGKAVPITMPQGMTAQGTTLPKPEAENWVPQEVTFPDGTKATLQRNSKSGEWTDLAGNAVPKERLATAAIQPKPAPGSNSKFSQEAAVYEKQWGKKIADWTPEELSYFNQKTAYDSARSGSSTTTRLEKDENGVIHPVEITNLHGPTRPPVDPHAGGSRTPSFTPPAQPQGLKVAGNISLGDRPILHNPDGSISSERSFSIGTDQGEVLIPRIFDGKDHTEQEAIEHYRKTGEHMGIFDTPANADAYAEAVHNRQIPRNAGEAKQRVAAHAPKTPATATPNVREGAPLSFKGTTPTVTKARNDVTEATKLSSIADQVSQNPNDAVNQKRLAVALERASAGRFTTQALNYIIKAGWGNTIEGWANSTTTGALPADVLRQLVAGAHQNLKASQDALRTAEGGGPPAATGSKEVHYKIVNGQLVAQ